MTWHRDRVKKYSNGKKWIRNVKNKLIQSSQTRNLFQKHYLKLVQFLISCIQPKKYFWLLIHLFWLLTSRLWIKPTKYSSKGWRIFWLWIFLVGNWDQGSTEVWRGHRTPLAQSSLTVIWWKKIIPHWQLCSHYLPNFLTYILLSPHPTHLWIFFTSTLF